MAQPSQTFDSTRRHRCRSSEFRMTCPPVSPWKPIMQQNLATVPATMADVKLSDDLPSSMVVGGEWVDVSHFCQDTTDTLCILDRAGLREMLPSRFASQKYRRLDMPRTSRGGGIEESPIPQDAFPPAGRKINNLPRYPEFSNPDHPTAPVHVNKTTPPHQVRRAKLQKNTPCNLRLAES